MINWGRGFGVRLWVCAGRCHNCARRRVCPVVRARGRGGPGREVEGVATLRSPVAGGALEASSMNHAIEVTEQSELRVGVAV